MSDDNSKAPLPVHPDDTPLTLRQGGRYLKDAPPASQPAPEAEPQTDTDSKATLKKGR